MIQYCKCGCGKETNIIKRTRKSLGQRKGDHYSYVFGHANKGKKQSIKSTRKCLKMIKNRKIERLFKKQEIVDYFLIKKLSMTKIAKKMKCSIGPIRAILKSNGINTSLKGKSLSLEHRKKLSENAKINPNYGMRGKKHSEETKKIISKLALVRPRPDMIGERNPMWKGDKVGYGTLHRFIRRHTNQPNHCQKCNKNSKFLDLANISGKYERDINDFQYLCRRCHMLLDGRMNNLKHNLKQYQTSVGGD